MIVALAGSGEPVYGVSTGFGSLADVYIDPTRRAQLQRSLVRSHTAGMGPPVEVEVVRAMMLLRARTLAMGWSGVRVEVVERLIDLLTSGSRRSCASTARSAAAATSPRARRARC